MNAESLMRRAALAYAGMGFAVFPCASRGKVPLTAHGVKEAVKEPEAIRVLWRLHPDANVGIATGAISGVVVLDIDPRHGGDDTLAALEAQHGKLPETPTVLTGGGGVHFYLRHPGGVVPNSASKVGPGIDVRGDGGYVIAPSSVHESGNHYLWEFSSRIDEIPLGAPPAWLLRLMNGTASGSSNIGAQFVPPPLFQDGTRNDYLYRTARSAHAKYGLDATEILSMLRGINEQRCKPPVDEVELIKIAHNAATRANRLDFKTDHTGKSALEAGAPFVIADALVAARFTSNGVRTLHHWQGSFWQWSGACFDEISDCEIRAVVGNYLHQNVHLVTTKPNGSRVSTNPNNWHTRNVFDALTTRTNLPAKGVTPPRWLSEADGSKSGHLIAVSNGLLDLDTRELYPATAKFFNLNALDVNYREGADCQHWLHFLEQLWEQDSQSIECLQEVVGYLLEPSNDQQKIFLLMGPMRSGKGTIARVIESMLGTSVVKPSLTDFTSPFGLEQIIGRSLAIVPDGRLGRDANSAFAVERMLSISGGDSPSLQRKYLPAYRGPTTCRFMILTNELPSLPDASGALASRIVLLRTFKSFLGNEDTNLFKGKLKPEMEGIFRWALDGWQRLRKRGHFVVPDSARGLLDDFVDLSNPLSDFINDRLALDPENVLDKEVVYTAYLEWAYRQDRKPVTRSWFFRSLGSLPGVDVACRLDEFTKQARDAQGNMVPRRIKGLRLK
jgi:P4 family phage/plasmid primase-like protien